MLVRVGSGPRGWSVRSSSVKESIDVAIGDPGGTNVNNDFFLLLLAKKDDVFLPELGFPLIVNLCQDLLCVGGGSEA